MPVCQLGLCRVGGFLAALLAAAPAYAVCGDGVWEVDEPCDDGNDVANDACNQCRLSCERIFDGLTNHTCGHGAQGPFVSTAAQSHPGVIYSDVSASHTYFTLTLSGEPGQNRSAALYSPGVDGLYAFYFKELYPFSVLSPAGDAVPLLFEHGVSCAGAGAGSLTSVKVYELRSQGTYTLAFGPTEGTIVSFAGELMEDLKGRRPSPRFWNRDGDEYGGALAGLVACDYGEQPDTVIEVPGDCDDSDANIHPAAPEICDGADSDCSGDDDAGARGLCDDDDAGSACVNAGAAIRCGCAVDADCEGEVTCNAAEQRGDAASGAGGASFGASGRSVAGEAAAAGAPSDAGRGASEGPGAHPSGSGRDARAADSGCSYSYSSQHGPSSAGLGLLAATALGLLRRRRS
jgi:MYXO-CTERM domain-containing protein